MAHLNLRDRVIETTIAYVGGEESASSRLAHVQRAVPRGRAGTIKETAMAQGRVLSLDWRPREEMRLNDCELTVKLVSTEAVGAETTRDVLVDADGLVLVVDAGDEAFERNQAAVATLRQTLALTPERKVPVVVQVNEDESTSGQGGLQALGDETWPRVHAKNATGDGLLETLHRAVGEVVETMQSHDAAPARPAGSPKVEGNPLLSALRQMLVATVSEQLVPLEGRLDERSRAQETLEASHAQIEKHLAGLFLRVDALTTQADVAAKRLEALLEAVHDLPAAGVTAHSQSPSGAPEAERSVHQSKMHALSTLVDELRKSKKWL